MERKLYRNTEEGALSGVCAGLGEYMQVDKTWVRLAFIISVIFSSVLGLGLLGIIVYIVLWIALPDKRVRYQGDSANYSDYDVDYRVDQDDEATFMGKKSKSSGDRRTAGLVLLGLGIFFLLHQLDFLVWYDAIKYWPVILIVAGIAVLYEGFRANEADAPVEQESNSARERHTNSDIEVKDTDSHTNSHTNE